MNVALMLVAVLAALINCTQLTTPTHSFNFFPLTMLVHSESVQCRKTQDVPRFAWLELTLKVAGITA